MTLRDTIQRFESTNLTNEKWEWLYDLSGMSTSKIITFGLPNIITCQLWSLNIIKSKSDVLCLLLEYLVLYSCMKTCGPIFENYRDNSSLHSCMAYKMSIITVSCTTEFISIRVRKSSTLYLNILDVRWFIWITPSSAMEVWNSCHIQWISFHVYSSFGVIWRTACARGIQRGLMTLKIKYLCGSQMSSVRSTLSVAGFFQDNQSQNIGLPKNCSAQCPSYQHIYILILKPHRLSCIQVKILEYSMAPMEGYSAHFENHCNIR